MLTRDKNEDRFLIKSDINEGRRHCRQWGGGHELKYTHENMYHLVIKTWLRFDINIPSAVVLVNRIFACFQSPDTVADVRI